ncbi:MAG TPA: FAD-binding protein, partial [Actinomycetota bacterium]|nr:FAD-binding protein [Actinomycetota bacterium]
MSGDAERILRERVGERLRTHHPLAPLTSFRLGGPASLFFEPETWEDLEAVGEAVSRTGVNVLVIGKGSNLLISDEGFPGLALRLGKGFRWTARDGERLTAGAAMPLPALAGVAHSHSLS